MTDHRPSLARLRALDKAATAAPWVVSSCHLGPECCSWIEDAALDPANDTLIAEGRNAMRPLLDTIDAVLALADEWDAEAERYRRHVIGSPDPGPLEDVARTLAQNADALRRAITDRLDTKEQP